MQLLQNIGNLNNTIAIQWLLLLARVYNSLLYTLAIRLPLHLRLALKCPAFWILVHRELVFSETPQ